MCALAFGRIMCSCWHNKQCSACCLTSGTICCLLPSDAGNLLRNLFRFCTAAHSWQRCHLFTFTKNSPLDLSFPGTTRMMASPKVIERLFNNQPILVTLGGVWDANLIYRRKRTNSLSYFQASASGGFCGPPSLNLELNVLYSKSWFNDFLKFLIAKFVDWNETNELKDKICRWYLLQ